MVPRGDLPPLWNFRTIDRAYYGDVQLHKVHVASTNAAGGGYYHTSTADANSWTKLRRLHHHLSMIVSRCL
jgi:hypothetical protein